MPPSSQLHKIYKNGVVAWFGCRVCRGSVQELLNLGGSEHTDFSEPPLVFSDGETQPAPSLAGFRVSDFPDIPDAEPYVCPLVLLRCNECGLVQLQHTAPRSWLYTHYWYRSGVNESMKKHLREVVEDAKARIPVGKEDTVLDIGANDGTLLAAYGNSGPLRVAYEPAENLLEPLGRHADLIYPTFFPNLAWSRIPPKGGRTFPFSLLDRKPKIIASIAMFYDLEDPRAFVNAIRDILHPQGVWIVELQYWPATLKACAFDTICHEHLEYYTLSSFSKLVELSRLKVYDFTEDLTNGGSIRFYVKHAQNGFLQGKPNKIADRAGSEAAFENREFSLFKSRIEDYRERIQKLLGGGSDIVDLYGASTKANTLLQYLGLGPERIRQAIERSEWKWGRFTVNGIPIVSEEEGRKNPASIWLVGPWHFEESVVKRETEYLKGGGQLLFPLPQPKLVWMKEGKQMEAPL